MKLTTQELQLFNDMVEIYENKIAHGEIDIDDKMLEVFDSMVEKITKGE